MDGNLANQFLTVWSSCKSHIWRTASAYMGKYLRISSYIIYDFATAPLWISLYMRKIWFSFLSVQPGGPVRQPYLTYRPARLHRLLRNFHKHGFNCKTLVVCPIKNDKIANVSENWEHHRIFFAVRYSYVHDFACILNNVEYLRTPCTFINKFSQPRIHRIT